MIGRGVSSYIISNYDEFDINYIMQVNIILIVKLLAKERLTLSTIKKHWGAGFELVYFSNGKFQKLDNVSYILNYGLFDRNGNIPEVPVPSIVMNYK